MKDTFTKFDRSEGASDNVRAGLYGVLSRLFEDSGYPIRFDATQIERWETTSPNDTAIKALQDHYDTAFCPGATGVLNCRPADKPSLLGDIGNIADSNQFDVLVLARGRGREMTRSARANPYETFDEKFSLGFFIGLIDITTGRSVYACDGTATGNYIGAPDARLSGPVQACLRDYFHYIAKHH